MALLTGFASAQEVRQDIAYRQWNGHDLLMDVYYPASAARSARLPVLIVLNSNAESRRKDPYYIGWAKTAVAHGFAAIDFDTHDDGIEEDFDRLVDYLAGHEGELHVDANRIAVLSFSGNATRGLPLVENATRTRIQAAVIYYGVADIPKFRLDLPLLFVRAGLDRPGMNQHSAAVIAEAVRQNAPITVLNYSGGHHAFDLVDNNAATREVIERTFAFLRSALSPDYQSALRRGIPEAGAAGAFMTGDYATASALYQGLVNAAPDDSRLLLSYAEALSGAARYKEARQQFDRVKTLGGVGPRDLGLPAARACIADGDPAAAIEWLKSIPKRFLPPSLQTAPEFASLRDRPDFLALFQ